MRSIVLANLALLLLVATAAAAYSIWYLAHARKSRGGRAMTRRDLRVWARIQNIQPHRFERTAHLRDRVRASMQPRRDGRAAGIRSDLDSKRAARA